MTENDKKKREIGKVGIKFKKASPDLIELLTDPYYNKIAPESIGEIKIRYYGG